MQLKEQLIGARAIILKTGMISMPKEVIELQKLFMQYEIPNFADVARIIGQNVILAGEVVQTANLPSMQGKRYKEVLTIHDAIDVLGVRRLKNLVKAIALKLTLETPGLEIFIKHSLGVASVSAAIAKQLNLLPSDEAYLLGLFHNVGAFMIAKSDPSYKELFQKSLSAPVSMVETELAEYRTSHGVVGLLVAESWGLEEPFKKVIIMHNEKNLQVMRNIDLRQMVALIQLANVIVAEKVFHVYLTQELQAMVAQCVDVLGLDEESINLIWRAI